MPPPSRLAAFWKLIDKVTSPDGCWLWTGYVNQPGKPKGRHGQNLHPRPRFLLDGGHFTEDGHRVGQKHVYAHRLTLALASGISLAQAEGLEACHTCSNPGHRCVSPYHQEWATPGTHRAEHQAERLGSFIGA